MDLEVKESLSAEQPFNRMLVKIKKEIIAFGIDEIDPRQQMPGNVAPKIPAEKLKLWLDEGREITLLDVRNDYEVAVGPFPPFSRRRAEVTRGIQAETGCHVLHRRHSLRESRPFHDAAGI